MDFINELDSYSGANWMDRMLYILSGGLLSCCSFVRWFLGSNKRPIERTDLGSANYFRTQLIDCPSPVSLLSSSPSSSLSFLSPLVVESQGSDLNAAIILLSLNWRGKEVEGSARSSSNRIINIYLIVINFFAIYQWHLALPRWTNKETGTEWL